MKKIILILPILILTGCVYYQPTAVSTNSIGGKYEKPMGIAQGVASRYYFFPCYAACPTGEDTLKAAIDDALTGRNADTLANVFIDRKTMYFPHPAFPLYVRHDVIVTGTLVKYNTEELNLKKSEFDFEYDLSKNLTESEILLRVIKTLVDGNKPERTSILRSISSKTNRKIKEYLLKKETDHLLSEKELTLFPLAIGRTPYLD